MYKYEILTSEGFKKYEKIIKKETECIKIILENGKEIKCSKNHRFYTNNRYAKDLKVGEKIGEDTIIKIENIGKQIVYSPLNVEDGHHYSSNGIEHYNCSFLGSSPTLVDGEALEILMPKDPIRTEDNFHLLIYEEPMPGSIYIMGVDSSTGIGNDDSVIQVIKVVNKTEFEQVAVYRNDKIKTYEFAKIVNKISKIYNDAMMIIENNECGKEVIDELWYEIGNGNIINTDKKGLGTRATPASKFKACMLLKKIVEQHRLKINDVNTISQLSQFEQYKDTNSFRAAKNGHDDLVSALYWAIYGLDTPQFDLEDAFRISEKENKEIEEEITENILFDESYDYSDFWKGFN